MKEFKKLYLMRISITTVFWCLIGAAFLLTRPYAGEFFDVLLIAIGLLMIVMNVAPLCFSLFHIKMRGEWINLLVSAAAVTFGVVLTLVPRGEVLFFLGVFSVLFPLVRVFLVTEHKKRVVKELPTLFCGIFMVLISLLQVEEKIFFISGVSILGAAALYFLFSLVRLKVTLSFWRESLNAEPTLPTEEPEQ